MRPILFLLGALGFLWLSYHFFVLGDDPVNYVVSVICGIAGGASLATAMEKGN